VRVRWEGRLFELIKERAMDGALEFAEQGCESNSNQAKTGFSNMIAHATGEAFLCLLSCCDKKVGRLSEAKHTK
jgi:hypothetical protein